METTLIKSKTEYKKAIKRSEELLDKGVKKGTPEGDELELLYVLIELYEKQNFPAIPEPDPIEYLKFRMDQENLKPKDLEVLLGSKANVSKILNKKQKLTLDQIRKLHQSFKISAELLIKDYEIA